MIYSTTPLAGKLKQDMGFHYCQRKTAFINRPALENRIMCQKNNYIQKVSEYISYQGDFKIQSEITDKYLENRKVPWKLEL